MKISYWPLLFLFCISAHGQEPKPAATPVPPNPAVRVQSDIAYLPSETDEYAQSQCRLDVYTPKESAAPFPLLVWFHGGGLQGGSKTSNVSVEVAQSLAARGIGVILAEYRVNPKVKFPVYINDAAAAVRWAVEHGDSLGAKPGIFVGGHSAGGYLAAMLAMDPKFLEQAGIKAEQIAGFICMSGQTSTHFTVAEERGFSAKVITVDDAAPIHHIRKETHPILLMIGGDDWPARLEENSYFFAAMKKIAENEKISFFVIPDRTHGSILKQTTVSDDPAAKLILEFTLSGKLPSDGSPPIPKKKTAEPAAL